MEWQDDAYVLSARAHGESGAIVDLLTAEHGRYAHVVASRDYHEDPGGHFAADPDFVDTWPVHCRVGEAGAAFHPELDVSRVEEVFSKGRFTAAYSAFEAASGTGQGLADWLRERDVDLVEVCGIATDHCVRATALDAAREGFSTTVLLDLTTGVAAETTELALAEMGAAGVSFAPSA